VTSTRLQPILLALGHALHPEPVISDVTNTFFASPRSGVLSPPLMYYNQKKMLHAQT
jgi:hypothetical protein